MKPDDLELLGAPILNESISYALEKKIGQAQVLTGRLGLLPAHQALFILKNCLSLPKLCYILRCSECWKFEEKLNEFDEVIRVALQSITNVPMSSDVWEQSSQPTVLGGLGIQKASDIQKAYISSVASSADLVSIIVPDSLLNGKLAN